ncbi:MAG TPA: iron-containing alcohol dehydrogenase [Pirellulales bacterium]|nr:iron-containing alcohol dehydrogenase [Pirellulales bacterium]
MTETSDLTEGYDLVIPRKITFGWGRRTALGDAAKQLGRRVFVVIGSRTFAAGRWAGEIEQLLCNAGAEVRRLPVVAREPLVADVEQCVAELRASGAARGDWLLAIGGGSAIDLAKAAGAIVTQDADARTIDFLEGVGSGRTIVEAPLPLVAMPTTGGTGSEATKNAVISSLDPPFKKSLRSEQMVPPWVIVDPELSTTVSAKVTLWTGMDAITQLIESYLTRRARPLPRALAIEGLRKALPAIGQAVREPASRPAREAMAHAALLSGMALANSGLGMAHGVAAALGVCADVPHGLACAVMLPVALRVNRAACERDLATLARAVGVSDDPDDTTAADRFVARITELGQSLGVPQTLGALGVKIEQVPALVAGSRGNSMSGNPCDVSDAELRELLEAML